MREQTVDTYVKEMSQGPRILEGPGPSQMYKVSQQLKVCSTVINIFLSVCVCVCVCMVRCVWGGCKCTCESDALSVVYVCVALYLLESVAHSLSLTNSVGLVV